MASKTIDEKMLIRAAFLKGMGWSISSIVLGLLQIILVYLSSLVNTTPLFNIDMFIFSGSLLFFISARMTSIIIEYKSAGNEFLNQTLDKLLFNVLPWIIWFISIALFLNLYYKGVTNTALSQIQFEESMYINRVRVVVVVLSVFSVFYSFFFKGRLSIIKERSSFKANHKED